jgi:signal transduction histidine kinase
VVLALNLLTLATSLAASHRLSAPLRHISLLTSTMPEQLDEDTACSWPSSMISEVDQLINNFRVMSEALNQKFREIIYANETLELRVEERSIELTKANDELQKEIAGHQQTEAQLDRLMTELQQKNKELEGIIYIASHDLRSPLVNVQGFSRKLAKNCTEIDRIITDIGPGADAREQLQPILRESIPKSLGFIIGSIEKMDNLLSGLLRLSRLGRAAICYETLDIQAVMAKIVASMTFQIEAAHALVETGRLAPCVADAVQLNQVFSNLMDNAIKYRSPDRQLIIRIFSEQTAEGVRYCFADNGIGIPHEHLDRIWEIFHRVNRNETQGEGLGLTMSRRIIDRLGGSMYMESEPGSGSRFYVTLPAVPVTELPEAEVHSA